MKRLLIIFFLIFPLLSLTAQNISIDKAPYSIIGIGATGDTNIYLCATKQKDSLIYPIFYKRDSTIWIGRTYFNTRDFDSVTRRIYERANKAPGTKFVLKNKAKIKIKKEFKYRVGMMPTFGWYVGKKKPGRYKQIGYRIEVTAADSLCFDGIAYYYLQKQSFFKRFFKKHKIKKRLKRLPILLGTKGKEVIFKNDMIQEGGQVKPNYYCFTLKEKPRPVK